MSLRSKTLIAVIGTFIGLMAVLCVISQTVILGGYERLEEEETRMRTERVLGALMSEYEAMEALNFDWAAWDDTYRFVKDLNTPYVKSNLTAETFAKQRLNLMLFVDGSGKAVYGKAFDLAAEKEVSLPKDLERHISPEGVLNRPQSALGIISFESGAMLVTSKPIMTSENKGPARGALVMGRMIDPNWTGHFLKTVKTPAVFMPHNEAVSWAPEKAGAVSVEAVSDETIAGYAALADIYGEPAVVLKIEVPRAIYKQGKTVTFYFLLYFFIAALALCAVSVIILERAVISRLLRLGARVSSIGRSADPSQRAGDEANGKDEVSLLARDIDRMLGSIEESQNWRSLAMEALGRSEERLRDVIDATNDLVWEVDADLLYTYLSPRAEEMLGYAPSATVGKTPFSMMEAIEAARFKDKLSLAAASKKPFTLSSRMLHAGGRAVDMEINAVPVFDGAGRLAGYRGINRDVTAKLSAEAEKENMRAQLLKSQKMEVVGRLASGVAHDFNNILTIVRSLCGLALKAEEREDALKYIRDIDLAAERAANLTRQLLIFSRNQPTTRSPLNLNGAIAGLLDMLGPLLGENISVRTSLDPGLSMISADRGNIEQLVTNIVVNAKDAMPDGGAITIRTANEGGGEGRGKRVSLTVEDTGCGIDDDVKERLFEPFFTTKEAGKGIGLGLAVTYDIVKEHRGEIEVTSKRGAGSRFVVYFPACEGAGQPVFSERKNGTGTPRGAGERILLVEDEKTLRKSVARVLSRHGFRISEAEGVEEAIRIFDGERGEFDLVFSDIVMKDRSGVDLARELIVKKPDIKILFTSGYMDIEHQWPFIKEKGFPFLQKPYGIFEMIELVNGILKDGR